MINTLFALASVAGFATAGWLAASIRRDGQRFDARLAGQIRATPGSGEFVQELTHWVYTQQGFAKNRNYFLFKRLGPTPMHVLEHGGDCSDKSRLLAALLNRFGMPATLVMLHRDADGPATHTVVETQYDGGKMVADPVFDIVFPAGNGKFHDVVALRDDPTLLPARLDALTAERGAEDKVAYYKRETESYSWPKTINWEKSPLLAWVGERLRARGTDPTLVMRPAFLEDPKRLLLYGSLLFGAATGSVALLPVG